MTAPLKRGAKLGKYRIEKKISDGGFARVYRAFDSIEGIRVALKIPYVIDKETLEVFRKEVRVCAALDHPNILSIKNASFIDDLFVIAFPLGQKSLDDRLQSRISLKTRLAYTEQMLSALAYAHSHHILHSDLKPENFILFDEDRIRLADFGIAKVTRATIQATGSGTLGFMAPEQAMGRPSLRSDVFAMGLILYRMFAGVLPEWPFDWPPPRYDKLRQTVHSDFIELIRRSVAISPADRYADGEAMLAAFLRLKSRALVPSRKSKRRTQKSAAEQKVEWQTLRWKQFLQRYRGELRHRTDCKRCKGPVDELMPTCPWCANKLGPFKGESKFPKRCPRCTRGIKSDWKSCAWCYGSKLTDVSEREYSDASYTARCSNSKCSRKELMPWMRYCPWCRTKVQKKWRFNDSPHKCNSCGWGIAKEFWSYCPWCKSSCKNSV